MKFSSFLEKRVESWEHRAVGAHPQFQESIGSGGVGIQRSSPSSVSSRIAQARFYLRYSQACPFFFGREANAHSRGFIPVHIKCTSPSHPLQHHPRQTSPVYWHPQRQPTTRCKTRCSEAELPKRQRDDALPAEVADVVKFTTHQTVGAVRGNNRFHKSFLPQPEGCAPRLSTVADD